LISSSQSNRKLARWCGVIIIAVCGYAAYYMFLAIIDADLVASVKQKNSVKVRWLLSLGANPNAVDPSPNTSAIEIIVRRFSRKESMEDKWTLLAQACDAGDPEIVRSLLAAGARVNQLNSNGVPPLGIAVARGNEDVVAVLLRWHAESAPGDDPVGEAARKGHLAVLRVLISAGRKVDTVDEDGMTPLLWASRRGDLDSVRLLLNSGANPNRLSGGDSPLTWACRGGFNSPHAYEQVVSELLHHGARAKMKDTDGVSPLWCAEQYDQPCIARILRDAGAPDE